ncbi:glycosyltransferase family 39 protein [Caulifigura coniformis]|uniref:glycosyltransferase family 39 protein n=1 Tax=Caulifigura coniformis TaxID=2527983 RepID=UPI00119F70E2|nr:glycosyltransferase family 39 protein [Caulifigura coniformis]
MLSAARIVAIVAVALITAAVACALLAAVPFDVIRPLGGAIRRVEDVTAERHARMIQVCLAYATGCGLSAVLLWRRRKEAAHWIAEAAQEFAAAVGRLPATLGSWGILVWVLFALGLGLRGMHLNDSMAYDESYTFNNLARQSLIVGIADYNSTNNHLLNTLLMHFSWRVFGDAEWALRLPVFVVGTLLLPLLWIWGSRWAGRPTAIVALALAAVSPLLTTYSADARGYILVTAAVLALDDAASRLFESGASKRLAWLQIVLAASFGLCAMPIMLYALVSVAGWVTVRTLFRLDRPVAPGVYRGDLEPSPSRGKPSVAASVFGNALMTHRWPLIAGGLTFCLIVGTMYAPAYIFRGGSAMRDKILEPISLANQLAAQWSSLRGGWEWCTAGFPPGWAWMTGVILGVLFFRSTGADRIRWLALPVSMLLLHLLGQVAPPPRVYIILLPFAALLASAGWVATLSRRKQHVALAGVILACIVAIGGTVYAATHPVLIFPAERTSFVSTRESMLELKSQIAADSSHPHRLIAPLPCDLPSIYYRDREHIPVEINGTPKPDDVLWLLARHGESPSQVLTSPLINLPNEEAHRPPFEKVATFRTLVLYRSPPGR